MKSSRSASAVLLVVMFGALVGCAHAKPTVGTTALTSGRAPWVPDAPFPAALLVETEEEQEAAAAAAKAEAPETWGVRPATPQEIEEFGF